MSEGLILALSSLLSVVVLAASFIRGKKSEAITEVSAIWAQLDRQNVSIDSIAKDLKAMNDYAQLLRNILQDNGIHVPPWPASLKDDNG